MSVSAVDVLLVGAGLIILFYWYLTRNFNYWKQRNVKTLQALPLFGSYYETFSFKKHFGIMVSDFYKENPQEKAIGLFKGRIPELLVNDPDLIKLILVKDFHYFENRGFTNNEKAEPLTRHLFLAKDETWKALRHKLTPTFTSGKMKKMFPLIAECGNELKVYIDNVLSEGNEYEIRDVMSKYTTDVIGSCAFGIKMQSMQEPNSPFREMGKKIFNTSLWRNIKVTAVTIAPRLFYALHMKVMGADIENFFINLFKAISEQRKTEAPRHDFIDLLLELKAKSQESSGKGSDEIKGNDIELTDELLAAQAFVFFAAGFETSSTTMSYCLHELAFNPEIQDKVFNDIRRVLKKHDDKITYEAVQEMKYLDMAIDETLRKYPPTGVLMRECTQKYTFQDENFTVDKGVFVTVPIYGIQHDPKYYPNPEKFDPERFTPEAISKRHPMTYLPFGDGPRNCIGLRFGKLETAVGLISVLKSFSVTPHSKAKKEMEYATKGLILASKNGIWLNLKPRL